MKEHVTTNTGAADHVKKRHSCNIKFGKRSSSSLSTSCESCTDDSNSHLDRYAYITDLGGGSVGKAQRNATRPESAVTSTKPQVHFTQSPSSDKQSHCEYLDYRNYRLAHHLSSTTTMLQRVLVSGPSDCRCEGIKHVRRILDPKSI